MTSAYGMKENSGSQTAMLSMQSSITNHNIGILERQLETREFGKFDK
jgi:hypothetical protein